jgi:hypothetical protein
MFPDQEWASLSSDTDDIQGILNISKSAKP